MNPENSDLRITTPNTKVKNEVNSKENPENTKLYLVITEEYYGGNENTRKLFTNYPDALKWSEEVSKMGGQYGLDIIIQEFTLNNQNWSHSKFC